jgi:CBS domain-containing protein
METVREVLARKADTIRTIAPSETVFAALRRMDEHHVGALMVMEGDQLVGIITERDYARKIILKGRDSKTTAVSEIMNHRVTHVSPDDTVDHCIQLMTARQVGYLPVLNHHKLIGVLSIRDLLVTRAAMQEYLLRQMGKG